MKYLFVIAVVIRGELVSLSHPLEGFQIIDNSGPDHTLGNSHSLLLWKQVEYNSDQEAIVEAQRLDRWQYSLNYDIYLRDGYVKSGHLLVHSIDHDCSIWNDSEIPLSYLFDGVGSSNEEYRRYGIAL